MNRCLIITAALASAGTIATSEASAQTALIDVGANYAASFSGDAYEPFERGIGARGALLFPLSHLAHVGADLSWMGADFKGSVPDEYHDASVLDLTGVVDVGLVDSESFTTYVDLRAGYSRVAWEIANAGQSLDGPTAGAGLGFRMRPGGVALNVFGRYQHTWVGEFDDGTDAVIFTEESTGGRIMAGAGVSIQLGGGRGG
jgi:hypothetical protein